MLVHGRQRRKAESAANFLQTRRIAVMLNELLEVVENFALPFGERLHGADCMQKKGESQRIPALPRLGPGPIDVIGFGENSVDAVATVPRWPVQDEKLELVDLTTLPGGQVASALVACARLGCQTQYIGVFGDDSHATLIADALKREGVDTTSCVRVSAPNRAAVVIVEPSAGTRTVLWRRDVRLKWPAAQTLAPRVSQARLLLVDSTDVAGSVAAAVSARSAGVPVVLDIDEVDEDGPRAEALLQLVDVLISAQGFPQAHTGERSLGQALRALHLQYKPAAVVVTLGASGSVAWDGTQEFESPGFAVDVVDPTGAGDAFRGGFMAAWIAARPGTARLPDLLRFGNATAALNCRAQGAQTGLPSKAEVQSFLTERGGVRSNEIRPANGTRHR